MVHHGSPWFAMKITCFTHKASSFRVLDFAVEILVLRDAELKKIPNFIEVMLLESHVSWLNHVKSLVRQFVEPISCVRILTFFTSATEPQQAAAEAARREEELKDEE